MKFEYKSEDLNKPDSVPEVGRPGGRVNTQSRSSFGSMVKPLVWMMVLLSIAGGAAWCVCSCASTRDKSGSVVGKGDRKIEVGANARQDASPVTKEDLVALWAYLEMTPSEIRHLYEYVHTSSFLNDNRQYAEVARQLHFYVETNNTVNAYATMKDDERRIVIYTGDARFARALGLAVTAAQSGEKGVLARFCENLKIGDYKCFSIERAMEIACACDLLPVVKDESRRKRAQSIAAGAVIATLAHEAGHQVLGHVLSGRARISGEVQRNQEREADSFASSVMSTSPFGEYQFVGRLLSHWMSWKLEEALGVTEDDADTHPLSRERFENLVRANRTRAAEFGFTVD